MSFRSFLNDRVTLHAGDCREVLATLPEASVDSVVCDPPYHLTSIVKRFGGENAAPAKVGKTGAYARASAGFMGKQWDGGDVAFQLETWADVLRVLKPGGYLLAFASTRGFGRMSVAIEDAGFITHPFVAWIFATGFPKATRVDAEGYEGFRYGGQALKPAIEPIYMGQKPFEKGLTGTENVLRWGTGALNIAACRVGADAISTHSRGSNGAFPKRPTETSAEESGRKQDQRAGLDHSDRIGRWPANLVLSDDPEVMEAFPAEAGGYDKRVGMEPGTRPGGFGNVGHEKGADKPNGALYGDSGSAARFFYTSKADQDDRLGSKHPTVKPLDLMQWLVRLVTPRGGTCLDPFAGTGTTGEAAWREGMRAILIEREPEYIADIERRMDLAANPTKRQAVAKTKNQLDDPNELPLFKTESAAS